MPPSGNSCANWEQLALQGTPVAGWVLLDTAPRASGLSAAMARLLITGGAGFIGSHTCVVLLEAGHELVVLDSFSNSSPIALERVAELAGVTLGGEELQMMRGDVRDATLLENLFSEAQAGQPDRSGDPLRRPQGRG